MLSIYVIHGTHLVTTDTCINTAYIRTCRQQHSLTYAINQSHIQDTTHAPTHTHMQAQSLVQNIIIAAQ